MKVDKNLYDKWKEKIISDIGVEKYKQLFFSTNEKIDVSPYYSDNKNTIINSDKLLFWMKKCFESYLPHHEIPQLTIAGV